jgi:hypothetical protein
MSRQNEVKKIISGIRAYDSEKVYKLDEFINEVAKNGSWDEIDQSLAEVEKFLLEELLNYDMVSKTKTA